MISFPSFQKNGENESRKLHEYAKRTNSFSESLLDKVKSGDWNNLGELIGDQGEYLSADELNANQILDLLKALKASEYPRIKEYFNHLIKNDLLLGSLSEEQMDELSELDPHSVLYSIDLTRLSVKRLKNLKSEYYFYDEKIQQAIETKEQAKKAHLWWCIAL